MEIGIVGYGQMGSFMAKLLAPFACISAFDPDPNKEKSGDVSLSEVCEKDLIFLFPPISQFVSCCNMIAEKLRPGTVVVEGCSVMEYPIKAMKEILPSEVELVGCHPLFGPQSGKNGIDGFKIVLASVRTTQIEVLVQLFERLNLEILLMEPEEHDRLMAKTQSLELLIGKILNEMEIERQIISTPGFDKLIEIKSLLEEDSEDILLSIQRYNPHAKQVRDSFYEHTTRVLQKIEDLDNDAN